MNDAGKSVAPRFLLTSQCQSVRKQYPIPYFNPKINHEKRVAARTIK